MTRIIIATIALLLTSTVNATERPELTDEEIKFIEEFTPSNVIQRVSIAICTGGEDCEVLVAEEGLDEPYREVERFVIVRFNDNVTPSMILLNRGYTKVISPDGLNVRFKGEMTFHYLTI